jgi:hypothetical protein
MDFHADVLGEVRRGMGRPLRVPSGSTWGAAALSEGACSFA